MMDKEEKTLPVSTADIDEVIDHRGLFGGESLCRVRIFRNIPADVTLLTELPNNPGNSISSCIEIVAGIVTDKFNLNPNRTIWIEHYPPKECNQFGACRGIRHLIL